MAQDVACRLHLTSLHSTLDFPGTTYPQSTSSTYTPRATTPYLHSSSFQSTPTTSFHLLLLLHPFASMSLRRQILPLIYHTPPASFLPQQRCCHSTQTAYVHQRELPQSHLRVRRKGFDRPKLQKSMTKLFRSRPSLTSMTTSTSSLPRSIKSSLSRARRSRTCRSGLLLHR